MSKMLILNCKAKKFVRIENYENFLLALIDIFGHLSKIIY